MPQGKLKVKAKLPKIAKKKNTIKGAAVSKRANCPIQPKKNKNQEAQKMKKMISKTVNKMAEDELRARAYSSNKPLSKAQKAVAAQHSTSENHTKKV